MKIKKIVQVVLISCSIVALASCSAKHKQGSDVSNGDMSGMGMGGAQASGVNDGSTFGSDSSAQNGRQKRTYYFDYDKSVVRDSDKPAINANADYLIAHASAKVIVEGHTDPRGSREYNVALGERRADAVADLLKARGVNPRQIRVVSYGAERLAAPGNTESDYQLDRRAVIVYSQR